jgi:orotidine-5'-phosphate decarboxylase
MTAQEKLNLKNKDQKFICVGLDTEISKIPSHLKSKQNNLIEFNKRIIEATAEYAAAYKFNLGFYEKEGTRGLDALRESISFIPNDILVIGDGKRGDIGNTSQKYAEMLYDMFNFDSATLNPYMGKDSIDPFLKYETKINFIITLTSNPGSEDFEKLRLTDGLMLYQKVIEKTRLWNSNNNCGLVFGATKTAELSADINLFGNLPVLLPGIGAQGGNFEEVFKIFNNNKKFNFLINVSRGILYKSSGEDFADQAKYEIFRMNKTITEITNDNNQ